MDCYSIHINDECVAQKARIANTFKDRAIGLMFSDNLGASDALIIDPCNSIHTFFMRYEIDVVFLDKKNKIVKIKNNMKPWRMTPIYFKASKVLEFMGGSLNDSIQVGMMVDFKDV